MIRFLCYKTPEFTQFRLNQQNIANCLHDSFQHGNSNLSNSNRCILILVIHISIMHRIKSAKAFVGCTALRDITLITQSTFVGLVPLKMVMSLYCCHCDLRVPLWKRGEKGATFFCGRIMLSLGITFPCQRMSRDRRIMFIILSLGITFPY